VKVPTWTKTKLANGADFIVSVKRGLPLVSVSVDFVGGAVQFEDPHQLGTATAHGAEMLPRALRRRTAISCPTGSQMLGTSIFRERQPRDGHTSASRRSPDKLDGALRAHGRHHAQPELPAAP